MIFRWAPYSVGSLSGGMICVWDVLYLGWFSFGLNERWNFRIVVRYFVSTSFVLLLPFNDWEFYAGCSDVRFVSFEFGCLFSYEVVTQVTTYVRGCTTLHDGLHNGYTFFAMGCMTSFVHICF